MTEVLTIDELAAWLKLSRTQVYSMLRKRGQARMRHPLPAMRINGNIRFRRQDVEAWLEKLAEDGER
jgi:excisionase family DNA binding protein